ncbi:MAG: glycosyltransferase family 2 protein [Rhodoluna sp.]
MRSKLIAIARRLLAEGFIPSLKYAVLRAIWKLSFQTRQNDESAPKVTLILPVYNVGEFLTDCLLSIRAQRWPNLEVIAVNDGSTDSSIEILEAFAASTPFLRIITKPNGGLGAARNTGLDAIEATDYVMFADSDDLLPLGAIQRFVRQAEASGNPLVVGKTFCFYGARYFERASSASLFLTDSESATVDEFPEVLGDVTAWNKLFSWTFWQQYKFRFPEGVAYEDMALMASAYLAAGKFDLVSAKSYFWRVRAEGQSLSQRKTELKSLKDRLHAITLIDRYVRAAINKGLISVDVHREYLRHMIALDFELFAPELARADEEFFAAFKASANVLLSEATGEDWASSNGKYRKVVWAAMHGSREQTLKVLSEVTA